MQRKGSLTGSSTKKMIHKRRSSSASLQGRTSKLSPLFEFFCMEKDLSFRIQKFISKLSDDHGDDDVVSSVRIARLESLIARLPSKLPSRDGAAPIPGERDHFYLRYFAHMSEYLDHILIAQRSPVVPTECEDDYLPTPVFYHECYGNHFDAAKKVTHLRGVLHYFDDGEEHPLAEKPVLSKRAKLHLRKMLARRARAAEAAAASQ
jgi:hypothetical protein